MQYEVVNTDLGNTVKQFTRLDHAQHWADKCNVAVARYGLGPYRVVDTLSIDRHCHPTLNAVEDVDTLASVARIAEACDPLVTELMQLRHDFRHTPELAWRIDALVDIARGQ